MWKRKIAFILAVLSVLAVAFCTAAQAEQRELAEKIVRLHVVANSDSDRDQALKLQVRDAVLEIVTPLMQNCGNPMAVLEENLPQIEAAAEKTLQANGCQDSVTVSLGTELFPTREYETFSLPSGVYRTLRVKIGKAEGHNWWCCVFPTLCMAAAGEEFERAAQVGGFTQSQIGLVTEADSGYVLKFKTVELLQALKNRINGVSIPQN